MLKRLLFGVVILVLFGLLVWSSDRITLQGERTIFTVNCENGAWEGPHCSGTLVPGERYAFRASVRRHEVIYWIRGSTGPSETYSNCTVVDRDNWSCNVRMDQTTALAYEMKNGRPTGGGQGLAIPFHDVPKWKWWVMRLGLHPFSDADS